MRLIIDLQGAQAESRNRGIGRYSLALAQAMARNDDGHQIHVALNGDFPESISAIRDVFDGLLPEDRFHVWWPTGSPSRKGKKLPDEMLREAFLASLKPDIVHVSSMFEGLGSQAVTSVGAFAPELLTAVTLYDLIPLIYKKPYLQNPEIAHWYFSKIAHLRRADLLLGISESATQEAVDHLGFDPARAVNISSAVDPHFVRQSITPEREAELRAKFGLHRPFFMYTGGIDYRKNLEGLIRAYARLPPDVRSTHQLAIVCAHKPEDKAYLEQVGYNHGLGEGELVLTGFVSEEDLVSLYNLCFLFVFASWHEGFGLPALEAMNCGAPVIGSNTSSLPEVIGREDALFDPRSDESIAQKMLEVIRRPAFRDQLIRHGDVQAARFSWDASATRALSAMQQQVEATAGRRASEIQPVRRHRPRLAFVSPLPPDQSGIADYSAELIPELAQHYEIDLIALHQETSDKQLVGAAHMRDVAWFESHSASYDRVIYQFGNSEFHLHMRELINRIPGVVVLHDFFLSGMYVHAEFVVGERHAWSRELYNSHGYAALHERLTTDEHVRTMTRYPCNFSVISRAIGVIVHSRYSRQLAASWYGDECGHDWQHIPLLRKPVGVTDSRRDRASLGLPGDAFVICSFGIVAETKLSRRLFKSWLASEAAKDPNSYIIFVGKAPGEYGAALMRDIEESGLAARVRVTGWADEETYRQYLAASDVAVQLRTSSRGETSAAVLDALNYGVATIVNANGSMAEFPDNVVCKLADDFEDERLTEALDWLHSDRAARVRIGEAGQSLILDQHSPRECATAYAQALEEAYGRANAGRFGLLMRLADEVLGDANVDDVKVASAITSSLPMPASARQVFLDVTDEMRAERSSTFDTMLTSAFARSRSVGFGRIEPVYWSEQHRAYVYARKFMLGFLKCDADVLHDEVVDVRSGDVLLISEDVGPSGNSDWLVARGVVSRPIEALI
jgi:glycosyltransferase involved in cell wall biosynthesis